MVADRVLDTDNSVYAEDIDLSAEILSGVRKLVSYDEQSKVEKTFIGSRETVRQDIAKFFMAFGRSAVLAEREADALIDATVEHNEKHSANHNAEYLAVKACVSATPPSPPIEDAPMSVMHFDLDTGKGHVAGATEVGMEFGIGGTQTTASNNAVEQIMQAFFTKPTFVIVAQSTNQSQLQGLSNEAAMGAIAQIAQGGIEAGSGGVENPKAENIQQAVETLQSLKNDGTVSPAIQTLIENIVEMGVANANAQVSRPPAQIQQVADQALQATSVAISQGEIPAQMAPTVIQAVSEIGQIVQVPSQSIDQPTVDAGIASQVTAPQTSLTDVKANVANDSATVEAPKVEATTPVAATVEAPKAEVATPAAATVEAPKAEVATPAAATVEVPKAEATTPVATTVEVPKAEVATPTATTVEVPKAEVATPTATTVEVPKAEVATPAAATVEVPKAEVTTPTAAIVEVPKAEATTPVAATVEAPNVEATTPVAATVEVPKAEVANSSVPPVQPAPTGSPVDVAPPVQPAPTGGPVDVAPPIQQPSPQHKPDEPSFQKPCPGCGGGNCGSCKVAFMLSNLEKANPNIQFTSQNSGQDASEKKIGDSTPKQIRFNR